MAEWLRDHDMYSGAHVGEWSDLKFAVREAHLESIEDAHYDDMAYQLRSAGRRPSIRSVVPG